MNLAYNITQLPDGITGYHVPAFTEGRLRVEHEGSVLVDLEDVLLVELAIFFFNWLSHAQRSGPCNFYYASMNFEEEPLLAMTYDDRTKRYTVESVFMKENIRLSISKSEAASSAEKFLKDLTNDLSEMLTVDLGVILRAARDANGSA